MALNINGNFPGSTSARRPPWNSCPTLTYSAGETPYKSAFFQGENAAATTRSSLTRPVRASTTTTRWLISPAWRPASLLKIIGRQGSKEMEFDPSNWPTA